MIAVTFISGRRLWLLVAVAALIAAYVVMQLRRKDYAVRFTKPVVVPDDDDGAEVTVSGLIKKVNPDGTVLVDLKAVSGGEKVLGRAQATVRPPT